tara:strand:+ start:1557 stop:2195 length:639 start_codon:yes stop_codon:yes gene_type:complete
MTEKYDKDYFENGLVMGISCYLNYRWLPELTIKMAHNIIKYLNIDNKETVLDYGCAKGYLVKALRILDIETYGTDISSYAIKNVDPEVRDFCHLMRDTIPIKFPEYFDWTITKDVLEHLTEKELNIFLLCSSHITKKCFHIIPLGNTTGFIIPDYNFDKTHVLAKPIEWWKKKFEKYGWEVLSFEYSVRGIKDNWTQKYPKGNGFFTLKYGK